MSSVLQSISVDSKMSSVLQSISVDSKMSSVLRDTKSNQTIEIFKCHIYNFVKSHTFEECCQMLGAAEYSYLLASKQIADLYITHSMKKLKS
jgi:hypothetical protein